MLGKIEGRRRRGWQSMRWLDGPEFEQTLRDGDGQGSLACCSPWCHKEADTAEWLRNSSTVHFERRHLIFYMEAISSSLEVKSWSVLNRIKPSFLEHQVNVIVLYPSEVGKPVMPCCLCAGCYFSHVWLCDPVASSPPGSSVHGILQTRILEWVAMPSSRGVSQPRHRTRVSHFSCIGWWVLCRLCHLGSPHAPSAYKEK